MAIAKVGCTQFGVYSVGVYNCLPRGYITCAHNKLRGKFCVVVGALAPGHICDEYDHRQSVRAELGFKWS
jgi:hypothetical protein